METFTMLGDKRTIDRTYLAIFFSVAYRAFQNLYQDVIDWPQLQQLCFVNFLVF